jgi:hypothetical protein
MLDLILFISLGVAVTVLAVWGGVVAVRTLPDGENRSPHLWVFIGAGVVAITLTIFIGIRNFYAQKESARQQGETRDSLSHANNQLDGESQALEQSRLAEEYMMGQLNALSQMMSRIGTGGGSSAQIASALSATMREMERTFPHASPTQNPGQNQGQPTSANPLRSSDSPYRELQAAIRSVDSFDGQWQRGFADAVRQRPLPSGQSMKFMPTPSQVMENSVRFDQTIIDDWRMKIEEPIEQARRDALTQMEPMTPNDKKKDDNVFSSAMETAATGVSISGDSPNELGNVIISQDQRGKVRDRFVPLQRYLNDLLQRLGGYIEKPTQPQ